MPAGRKGVHVLVVTATDGVRVRLAVERTLRDLGWLVAWSPADADVLAVCGTPTGDEIDAVELLWHQLPGPRARVDIAVNGHVASTLAEAASTLDDAATQTALAGAADAAAPGRHHEDMSSEAADHGDMDHGDMDHGDMDHGGMDMSGPAGIPLAMGADDDRDGLEMDAFHLVLGGGLPGWPAGLVLRATLHGDVVTAVQTLASAGASASAEPVERSALLADAAATVLDLAGWTAAAARSRVVRDGLLEGRDPTSQAAELERLARRVRRSVLLRWSLEGPRRRGQDARPTPGRLVRLRLLAMLDTAVALLRDPADPPALSRQDDLAGLPQLAVGQELGTLRLLVASLALDARAVSHA